jgi:diacylglycerol kinase
VEWLFVVLAIAAVLSAELFNCAVERLAPSREQQLSSEVALLKDASAAAVLITSAAAAVVGVVVFVPYCLAAFR